MSDVRIIGIVPREFILLGKEDAVRLKDLRSRPDPCCKFKLMEESLTNLQRANIQQSKLDNLLRSGYMTRGELQENIKNLQEDQKI